MLCSRAGVGPRLLVRRALVLPDPGLLLLLGMDMEFSMNCAQVQASRKLFKGLPTPCLHESQITWGIRGFQPAIMHLVSKSKLVIAVVYIFLHGYWLSTIELVFGLDCLG